MNCYNHQSSAAVGLCKHCGKGLCAACTVDLGHGLTGYILHDTFEGVRGSVLYWMMPVSVDGDVFHARIALFGDEVDPTSSEGLATGVEEESAASVRLGQALESAMDGIPDGEDDPVRAQIDRDLTALAVTIANTMIRTGGPAEVLDAIPTEAPRTAPDSAAPQP